MSKPATSGYFAKGLDLARKGKWEAAAAAYKLALEAEPRNVQALMNLGFVYYEMGLDDDAKEALDLAERLRASPGKCDPVGP